MDFNSSISSIQAPLSSVVDYAEVPVGSMMSLMTEKEQQGENQLLGSAICSPFGYCNPQAEPYLQANVDKIPPNGCHFGLEQFQGLNILPSFEALKPEVLAKLSAQVDCRENTCPHTFLLTPQLSAASQETRVLGWPMIVEPTIAADNPDEGDSVRAKILSHPNYPQLVAAYMNCQKVGAPPEVVARLEELSKEYHGLNPLRSAIEIGADPELDEFMDTYYKMLTQYHEELTRPFKEAMVFIRKIELQLNCLSKGSLKLTQTEGDGEKPDMNGSSEEDDISCSELEFHDIDRLAEDNKIKERLLRRYSGHIGRLKKELSKKKKKGKLPKEARQKLLDWWNQHYKWPYPSELEKSILGQTTGLEQKQINNWFINQRKRHWKPSEDMRYIVVESQASHGMIPFATELTAKPEGSILIP